MLWRCARCLLVGFRFYRRRRSDLSWIPYPGKRRVLMNFFFTRQSCLNDLFLSEIILKSILQHEAEHFAVRDAIAY
jgi:hypothetical protein